MSGKQLTLLQLAVLETLNGRDGDRADAKTGTVQRAVAKYLGRPNVDVGSSLRALVRAGFVGAPVLDRNKLSWRITPAGRAHMQVMKGEPA